MNLFDIFLFQAIMFPMDHPVTLLAALGIGLVAIIWNIVAD